MLFHELVKQKQIPFLLSDILVYSFQLISVFEEKVGPLGGIVSERKCTSQEHCVILNSFCTNIN